MQAKLLSKHEATIMMNVISGGQAVDMTISSKLCEAPYKLKTGKPADAASGLEYRMNVSGKFHNLIAKKVEGIQEEVNQLLRSYISGHSQCCAWMASDVLPDPAYDVDVVKEVAALLRYILYEPASEKEYPNGTRDKGRGPVRLEYFLKHEKAIEAKLETEEVVALRLYTTCAYILMNNPLRDDDRHNRRIPCPLPVTTHFAAIGIKKLRKLNVSAGAMTMWRGMRNIEVADNFMTEGGTELAFMSTTTNLEIAMQYSLSAHSLLFKIASGGFMTTGADVQWLSAFPGEAEFLYPPLTYLKPTGRTKEVLLEKDGQLLCYKIVEVEPQLA